MSAAHPNTELPLPAEIARLFLAHCGRGKAVEIADLAALSGLAGAQVYAYTEGKHLGSAVALANLCAQCPEAMQALANRCGYMVTPLSAQQGHGEIHGVMAWLSGALHRYMKRLDDGKFCHRDHAETVNDFRRGMKKIGLWLVASVRVRA